MGQGHNPYLRGLKLLAPAKQHEPTVDVHPCGIEKDCTARSFQGC